MKDTDKTENVQRYFTKRICGLQDLSYLERLSGLELETLEERRIKCDLMAVYNIIIGNDDVHTENLFELRGHANRRGHPWQLKVRYTRLDIAKHFFFNRVVRVWTDLPRELLNIPNTFRFKAKLFSELIKRHCKV